MGNSCNYCYFVFLRQKQASIQRNYKKKVILLFWGIILYLAVSTKLSTGRVHPPPKSHFNFCLKTPCDRSIAPSWKVLKDSRLWPACSQAVSGPYVSGRPEGSDRARPTQTRLLRSPFHLDSVRLTGSAGLLLTYLRVG